METSNVHDSLALKDESHIVRRSLPLLIVRLIFVEILLLVLFLLLRFFLNMLFLQDWFNFQAFNDQLGLIAYIFTAIAHAVAIFVIATRWGAQYYEIKHKLIVYHAGVFSKRARQYSLQGLQSIEVQQSVWGRMLRYGTVVVYSPVLKQELLFDEVTFPFEFAEMIKRSVGDDSMGIVIRRR